MTVREQDRELFDWTLNRFNRLIEMLDAKASPAELRDTLSSCIQALQLSQDQDFLSQVREAEERLGLRPCGCPPPEDCPGRHATHLRTCSEYESCQGPPLCLGSDECDGH